MVLDTGSPVRSSILSAARRTPPTSRAPHRVGEVPRRRLGTRSDERVDVGIGDVVASGPGRELVDLTGELVQVVAHELRKTPARLRLGGRSIQLELVCDPPVDRPRLDVPDQHLTRRGDRLCERRVLSQLGADEGQGRAGSRRPEVLRHDLHVCRLPDPDVVEEHEPGTRYRTARARCRPRPRRRPSSPWRRATRWRRARTGRVAARPRGRLRTVAARNQIHGLELVRHRPKDMPAVRIERFDDPATFFGRVRLTSSSFTRPSTTSCSGSVAHSSATRTPTETKTPISPRSSTTLEWSSLPRCGRLRAQPRPLAGICRIGRRADRRACCVRYEPSGRGRACRARRAFRARLVIRPRCRAPAR